MFRGENTGEEATGKRKKPSSLPQWAAHSLASTLAHLTITAESFYLCFTEEEPGDRGHSITQLLVFGVTAPSRATCCILLILTLNTGITQLTRESHPILWLYIPSFY